MTLSEKNTLLDYARNEVDTRLKALRRTSAYKNEPKMYRALGEVKEAERNLKNLQSILRKL